MRQRFKSVWGHHNFSIKNIATPGKQEKTLFSGGFFVDLCCVIPQQFPQHSRNRGCNPMPSLPEFHTARIAHVEDGVANFKKEGLA